MAAMGGEPFHCERHPAFALRADGLLFRPMLDHASILGEKDGRQDRCRIDRHVAHEVFAAASAGYQPRRQRTGQQVKRLAQPAHNHDGALGFDHLSVVAIDSGAVDEAKRWTGGFDPAMKAVDDVMPAFDALCFTQAAGAEFVEEVADGFAVFVQHPAEQQRRHLYPDSQQSVILATLIISRQLFRSFRHPYAPRPAVRSDAASRN
jgi:hypothetical protein